MCRLTGLSILFNKACGRWQPGYKPSSVQSIGLVANSSASVIYLDYTSLYSSSNLPSDMGRATLIASVYMILQPIRRTAPDIATKTGELLPHLFTITEPRGLGCRSLLRYSDLTACYPLGSMVLCVARTFLIARP